MRNEIWIIKNTKNVQGTKMSMSGPSSCLSKSMPNKLLSLTIEQNKKSSGHSVTSWLASSTLNVDIFTHNAFHPPISVSNDCVISTEGLCNNKQRFIIQLV